MRENAFEQKRKKPGLKFNPGLALIGLWTTGPWSFLWNCTFLGMVWSLPPAQGSRPKELVYKAQNTITILGLRPRDKVAMLGVKTVEVFLKEFTWK